MANFFAIYETVSPDIAQNLIHFEEDETIFMEISQKYSIEVMNSTALESGFTPVAYFLTAIKYFTDVIWRVSGSW